MPAPEYVPMWPAYLVRFIDSGTEPIRVQLRDGDIWRTEQQTGQSIAKLNLGDPEFYLAATWHGLRRMKVPTLPAEFEEYIDLVDVVIQQREAPAAEAGELGKATDLDPPTG
jgi:hypothetical protein